MADFAVWHEGMAEGTGFWVLAIDARGERVLLAGADGGFYWRPLADCKLMRAHTPDMPIAVVAVQPQNAAPIIIPGAGTFQNGHRN